MPGTKDRAIGKVHDRLHKSAAERRMTISTALDSGLAEYERKLFWSKTAAEFQALRNDPKAWKGELEEREAWDVTLTDVVLDRHRR